MSVGEQNRVYQSVPLLQLNIKLLVARVHNMTVLLIINFFDFILFISWSLQFSGAGIHFKNVVLPEKVSYTHGNFHFPSI